MSENRNWQIATLVKSELASVNVKSLVFKINPSTILGARAGQHYDIRLTAPNGYVAERSYSVASPPEQSNELEFGVQLLENGEVSPYLWQMNLGEQVEVRGPIGGHFTWCHTMPGPLVLIGVGSGVVPLVSMIRHWQKNLHLSDEENKERKVILLASFRSLEHVLYKQELEKLELENNNFKFVKVLTDHEARINSEKLKNVLGDVLEKMPMIYICGPTKFVEAMANNLVALGTNPHLIKTERFG